MNIGELTMRWYFYLYNIPNIIGVAFGAVLSLLIGLYLLVDGRYFIKLAFGKEADKAE